MYKIIGKLLLIVCVVYSLCNICAADFDLEQKIHRNLSFLPSSIKDIHHNEIAEVLYRNQTEGRRKTLGEIKKGLYESLENIGKYPRLCLEEPKEPMSIREFTLAEKEALVDKAVFERYAKVMARSSRTELVSMYTILQEAKQEKRRELGLEEDYSCTIS